MSSSPSGSRMSGTFAMFSVASSVSTRGPEGSEDWESGAFVAEEVDGAGDKGPRLKTVDVETTLWAFLEDYQSCDHVQQLLNF
jgi:hypothetical protein